jgi:hypothetical protein
MRETLHGKSRLGIFVEIEQAVLNVKGCLLAGTVYEGREGREMGKRCLSPRLSTVVGIEGHGREDSRRERHLSIKRRDKSSIFPRSLCLPVMYTV